MSDSAALAAVVAAASTKLRVLARPISEFSSCRREWVLKLGKAVAMAFMQKAAGALGEAMLTLWSFRFLPAEFQVSLAQLFAVYWAFSSRGQTPVEWWPIGGVCSL
jgi:hypothetical protein